MRRCGHLSESIPNLTVAVLVCLSLSCCRFSRDRSEPFIEFTRVPPSGEGSPDKLESIEGRVSGAQPGERIVLFARSGIWWAQPFANQPFTTVRPDSKWQNLTHPGTAYAALLVDSRFNPMPTAATLPTRGGAVLAVAIA